MHKTRNDLPLKTRKQVVEMLNALIKAENDVTNIRDIVRTEQMGGEQFHLSPALPRKHSSSTAAIQPPALKAAGADIRRTVSGAVGLTHGPSLLMASMSSSVHALASQASRRRRN